MLRAIIFDYNGVLVDDVKIHEESYLSAAKAFEVPLSRETVKQHISYAPEQKRKLYFGDISDDRWEELLRTKERRYFEMAEKADIVFPEVDDVLTLLAKKYTLSLVSNTPRNYFNRVFPRHLAGLFGESLFVDEVEKPKPSPAPLLKMIDRLGIQKDQCCYVGDSVLDIQMSKAAGVFIFAAATGENSDEELRSAGADVVLTSLRELEKRIILFVSDPVWHEGNNLQSTRSATKAPRHKEK